ncbi:hypothetical protein [Gottfriedia solisilvae]|uniref:Uncharacterized protein n=1 Tax=Gottfriedia solisilvae TaxID=1516104 RepID=A0A8J3AVZ2_9BACI|nr:hypothetical protein [Gottfriedia solisilvae]GGI17867.1 hypothetical protein GCM10007380_40080 [Gottfriedia solisilvae]
MTIFGYLFWGIGLFAIALGFFMQKKYGTKAPIKSNKEIMNEEITRITHSNDRPRI